MKACSEGRAGDVPGLRTVLLVTVLVILFVTLSSLSVTSFVTMSSLSHSLSFSFSHLLSHSLPQVLFVTLLFLSHCLPLYLPTLLLYSACQIVLFVPHASFLNQDLPLNLLPSTRCIYNLVCLIASFEKRRKDLFHNKN